MFLYGTVIGLAVLHLSAAHPQTFDAATTRDAAAVYSTVLQPLLEPDQRRHEGLTEPLVLQAETEAPTSCAAFLDGMSGEWAEVANNFRRENSRARPLRTGLPVGVTYRLVSRTEILADDARLAAQDPAMRNAPRPGSIRYIALSAVGFNAARTKALVYVRFRTLHFSDAVLMKELKDGKWVTGPRSCGGVA